MKGLSYPTLTLHLVVVMEKLFTYWVFMSA